MTKCITCGTELHPERSEKYDYCTAPECQEKNAKGLTIVAIGQNKAADEYAIFDERTREEIASGRYRDQRRVTTKPAEPSPHQGEPVRERAGSVRRTPPASAPVRTVPWSSSQERLALLYNEQGIRPAEIARRVGLSTYNVTQIILARRAARRPPSHRTS